METDTLHAHEARSPTSHHSSVAILVNDAPEYCWVSFSFEPAERMVTPAPPTVTCPAPSAPSSIFDLSGKATVALVGTVRVMAPALFKVTSLPLSVSTRV